MNKAWAAEIAVDGALAKALIEDQFRRLLPAIVEPLGAGWDNSVFRVNGQFVFRFPRRAVAVELIQTELRCLPLLGPRLPVPIPIPVYAGQPSPSYPWPFAGYSYLSGRGFPRGLHGDEIPLEARIAAVCDAYDAMTSDRSYRRSLGREGAVAELSRGAGAQFDPACVEALIAILPPEEPDVTIEVVGSTLNP